MSPELDISHKEIATTYGKSCTKQPPYIVVSKQLMAYMKYSAPEFPLDYKMVFVYASNIFQVLLIELNKGTS